jgi:nucleotide-binding universal stress UspA family protein
MTGTFTMNQRLEAERQLVRSTLDPSELELLAAQSQKLLDDALARARAKQITGTIIDVGAAPSPAPAIPAHAESADAKRE